MSNFAMGTILGKGFAQAQVHTNHSTSAISNFCIHFFIFPSYYSLFVGLLWQSGRRLRDLRLQYFPVKKEEKIMKKTFE
jgi:hypothetical protein